MTTRSWIDGQGSFTDATEWTPAGVPGSGDTAVLGAGAQVATPDDATLNATVLLTDPTASLTVQGYTTDTPAAGAVAFEAVGGGGALLGATAATSTLPDYPYLNAGLLLVGSPSPATPFVIRSAGGVFTLNSTLDVVGSVSVTGAGAGTNSTSVFLGGAVAAEPGGDLVTSGSVLINAAATIAGGTLDASQSVFGTAFNTITFDGSVGTLVVKGGGTSKVANFRAGDVIDVKGATRSGTLSFSSAFGGYLVGGAVLSFTGPTTAGATYTATPDGTGGSFVTVSGPAAGRAPASQYVFGFTLSAAGVTFRPDGHELVTAPNGTVTDVTGVATLQFLDGTIGGRTGNPVDPLFYYARNPDVWAAYTQGGLDAAHHYDQFGWKEGRDPDALFSTRTYLAAYPDIAAAGIDPAAQYDNTGWKEGRDAGIAFSPEEYRAAYPDIAAAGTDPLVHFLEYGAAEGRYAFPGLSAGTIGDFDPQFYLAHNPDVAAADPAGITAASFALQHYLAYGWKEGRDPDALFSTSFYLAHNQDVARAGVDPLLQFEQFGWREGRNPGPGFNTAGYLAHNPDVAAAGIDPLQHYLQHGMAEGRAPG